MSWQNSSAWGLTGTTDRDWVRQSVCRGAWDLFDVIGKELTATNEAALALCADCPVRAACRDDYLSADRTPLGVVAGGWWWDYDGRAHPHPDDHHLAAAATWTRHRSGHVYAARKAVTAARAVAAEGLTHRQAAHRTNSPVSAVDAAVTVFRYAPDLLTAVWDGDQTLAAAHAEASRRRDDSRQLEGAAL